VNILEQHGINSSIYKLGNLCKRNHAWNGLSQSLRTIASGNCVECHRIYVQKRREMYNARKVEKYWQDPETARTKNREYRRSNPEKTKAAKKRDYEKHREKRLSATKKWIENNREAIKLRRKAFYDANRKRLLEEAQIYYQKNRQEILRRNDQWRQRNPEKEYIRQRRRHHRKKCVHCVAYTHSDIKQRFLDFNNECAYCGSDRALTRDHFIPVFTGGADVISNIVCACHSCNASKRDNDPHEWYAKQPFYSKMRWRKILKVLGKAQENYTQIPLL